MLPSDDPLETVRVLTKQQTIQAVGLSEDTWLRLEERGETPPLTRISAFSTGSKSIQMHWSACR